MGADFCCDWVALKLGSEEETKKKLFEAIDVFEIPELSSNSQRKVLSALKSEKSDNFKYFCSFWEEGINGDFKDSFPIEEDKVITEKRAKEIMKEVVERFFECLGYRDVGIIDFKGYSIYISGGMSWGDNPTESMGVINKLNYLPEAILKAGDI